MKLTILKKIFILSTAFQLLVLIAIAQNFTPNFDPQNPVSRKKKQKEIPRFPPQFRAKDTVGGKVSPAFVQPKQTIGKTNSTTTTTIIQAAPKPKNRCKWK
jgi:hypothetical protein